MRDLKQLSWLTVVIAALPVCAQTNVTTSAPTSTGTVPVFGPSSNSTVTNSVITQSGSNIGIGTTSPSTKLDVEGGSILVGSGTLHLPGGGDGINPSLHFTNYAPPGFNPGGNIGLWLANNGLINANAGLLISGLSSSMYPLQFAGFLSVEAYQAGSPWSGGMRFGDNSGWKFVIGRQWENTSHSAIDTGSTGALMTVQDNGNVGIGTTNPQARFEINGNLRFTADGSVQTTAWTGVLCGGDYAESMNATGDRMRYSPGDALVLDASNPGKVLKSVEPYSTAVAGIYATKPGVVGRRQAGPKNEAEVPMAMIGVVPTKVSTENGPIKVGDLLVTSSIPGYAMKGTDRSRMLGAVIGKAMASLDSGSSVIEVLVTLQ